MIVPDSGGRQERALPDDKGGSGRNCCGLTVGVNRKGDVQHVEFW